MRVGREGDWQIFALTRVTYKQMPFEDAEEPLRRRLVRSKIRQRGMALLEELLASSTVVLNRMVRWCTVACTAGSSTGHRRWWVPAGSMWRKRRVEGRRWRR